MEILGQKGGMTRKQVEDSIADGTFALPTQMPEHEKAIDLLAGIKDPDARAQAVSDRARRLHKKQKGRASKNQPAPVTALTEQQYTEELAKVNAEIAELQKQEQAHVEKVMSRGDVIPKPKKQRLESGSLGGAEKVVVNTPSALEVERQKLLDKRAKEGAKADIDKEKAPASTPDALNKVYEASKKKRKAEEAASNKKKKLAAAKIQVKIDKKRKQLAMLVKTKKPQAVIDKAHKELAALRIAKRDITNPEISEQQAKLDLRIAHSEKLKAETAAMEQSVEKVIGSNAETVVEEAKKRQKKTSAQDEFSTPINELFPEGKRTRDGVVVTGSTKKDGKIFGVTAPYSTNTFYSGLDPALIRSLWTDMLSPLFDLALKPFNKYAAWSTGKLDQLGQSIVSKALKHDYVMEIFYGFGSNMGLDTEFKNIMRDFEQSTTEWTNIGGELGAAIKNIDRVFKTVAGETKEYSLAAVDKRARQIAEGSIGLDTKTKINEDRMKRLERVIADPRSTPEAVARAKTEIELAVRKQEVNLLKEEQLGKFDAVYKVRKRFKRLETMLRDRGMLGDNQFTKLTKQELTNVVGKLRKDRKEGENPWNKNSLRWLEHEYKTKTAEYQALNPQDKNLMSRESEILKDMGKIDLKFLDLTGRLRIHYKNSGRTYVSVIKDKIANAKRSVNQTERMSMDQRWKLRRDNWSVRFAKDKDPEPTGSVIVKRKGAPLRNDSHAALSRTVAKGISMEARDAFLNDLNNKIAANEEWTWQSDKKKPPEGYTQMPNDTNKYGALAGKYVKTPIQKKMQDSFRDLGRFERKATKIMSFWKLGKVVYSFAAQSRNFFSNMILADVLGDVNIIEGFPKHIQNVYKIRQHQKNEFTNDQILKAFKLKTSLLTNTFAKSEIDAAFWESLDMTKYTDLGSKADSMWKFAGMIGKWPPDMFSALESGMKYTVFEQNIKENLKKMGETKLENLSKEDQKKLVREAEDKANYALFDYGDVPPGIRWMRTWYMPFITFTYKMAPRIAKTAVTKPWKIIKYHMFQYAVQAALDKFFEDDDEDTQGLMERLLPDYVSRYMIPKIASTPASIKIPIKDKYGRNGYFDLSYILPWGALTGFTMDAGQRSFMPNNPFLIMYSDIRAVQNLFLGRPLGYDSDSPLQSSGNIAKYVLETIEPGASRQARTAIDKIFVHTKDKKGRDHSIGEVIADNFFGLKIRRYNISDLTPGSQYEMSKFLRGMHKKMKDRINRDTIQYDPMLLSDETTQKNKEKSMRDTLEDGADASERYIDMFYHLMGKENDDL
jgi:hypothetical protein